MVNNYLFVFWVKCIVVLLWACRRNNLYFNALKPQNPPPEKSGRDFVDFCPICFAKVVIFLVKNVSNENFL